MEKVGKGRGPGKSGKLPDTAPVEEKKAMP
jgi:hypothetical protein